MVLDTWEGDDVGQETTILQAILDALEDMAFQLRRVADSPPPPAPTLDLAPIALAIERMPPPASLDPVVASLARLERDAVTAANNSTLLLGNILEILKATQTAERGPAPAPSRYVAVGGGANMATTESLLARLPDLTGTWGYYAGVSGTVVMAAGQRVTGIAAHATLAGSMTVNAGASITIPADTGIWLEPQGQLVAPTLVFTGTDTYVVEYLT
jgi:hypothetical protein